jgi:hypothetical protein
MGNKTFRGMHNTQGAIRAGDTGGQVWELEIGRMLTCSRYIGTRVRPGSDHTATVCWGRPQIYLALHARHGEGRSCSGAEARERLERAHSRPRECCLDLGTARGCTQLAAFHAPGMSPSDT